MRRVSSSMNEIAEVVKPDCSGVTECQVNLEFNIITGKTSSGESFSSLDGFYLDFKEVFTRRTGSFCRAWNPLSSDVRTIHRASYSSWGQCLLSSSQVIKMLLMVTHIPIEIIINGEICSPEQEVSILLVSAAFLWQCLLFGLTYAHHLENHNCLNKFWDKAILNKIAFKKLPFLVISMFLLILR